MEISIDLSKPQKTFHLTANNGLDGWLDLIAECSANSDRELLLDMASNNLEPKRAPELLDFIGRSYKVLENNTRFHTSVKNFFQNVIWKRFQKVVWSDKGTVGIDVPIEPSHVQTFLKVAKLPTTSSYVNNILRFLTQQAAALR